jgi:hypothetical protein
MTFYDCAFDYRGQRAITLPMMDGLHGLADGAAASSFRQHRGRLREGQDYFTALVSDLPSSVRWKVPYQHFATTVLAQSGYLAMLEAIDEDLLAKALADRIAFAFGHGTRAMR